MVRFGALVWIGVVAGGCIGGGGKDAATEGILCVGEVPEVLSDNPDADVDYEINCVLTVGADQSLTIEPGVVIQFGEGGGLRTDGGLLKAEGTAELPISLEAADPAVGWLGVQVFGDIPAVFGDVRFSGAGLETPEGAATLIVGAPSYAEGRAEIRDCVFEAGFGNGINLYGELLKFTGNVITGHVLPMQVSDHSVDQLQPDNDLTGNDTDAVEILPQAIPTTEEQIWSEIGVPWLIRQGVTFDGEQTINGGAQILLSGGASVVTHAPIHLQGSQGNPVVFDSLTGASGEWNSLYLTTGKSDINFTEFRNGSGLDDIFGQAGMLIIDGNTGGSVEIRDCVFEGGAAWGIWIGLQDSYNTDIESANTFSNNAAGDVRYPE